MPSAKETLPTVPGGASVQRNPRKPQSDTAQICAAYLKLLDVIEQHGSGFAFPREDNPTGNTTITFRNTLAEQSFYTAIQLADFELPHMLRGDPEHAMIEAKRAAINALVKKL